MNRHKLGFWVCGSGFKGIPKEYSYRDGVKLSYGYGKTLVDYGAFGDGFALVIEVSSGGEVDHLFLYYFLFSACTFIEERGVR